MSIYTKSERTVKKYTVQQAFESALNRLKGQKVCINAITKFSRDHMITLEELNNLADQMVNDSNYWNN